MPIFLSIETSTEHCSVQISDENGLKSLQISEGVYSHAAELTILIQKLLAKSQYKLEDIDAVAISRGPGSFTSLRVGSAVAKGICFALDIPLISVDTLLLLALPFLSELDSDSLIIPMIDARRKEVYMSIFDKQQNQILKPQALILEENCFQSLIDEGKSIVICGNAANKAQEILNDKINIRYFSNSASAEFMYKSVLSKWRNKDFADVAYFEPFYLKPPNITLSKKKLL